ncbi:D-alanyl-D-alanine carboxypeptidase/D-alanyl-D-alanine endopeptidase [Conexibacter arvalis]|uniref:D-alanyl-D-alanine carboxypeptidase/D-alanyl-D-alanine-endopeptidase (Penicillin-binding protein 4) n=1 Tax=Conexibacter arvalis TaxID=912552 RepID=A0A840I8U3_9ACTN|nr:D-alanyl-D-alanine carboxypeptidase/D-alanyl-D-alanine-endopeptidase [Conexibacter arvalis]MBB4660564.1 D-alanyl-D-alanine carboxypeptidase/D-alanyl-D-alanine-endopeptidase (penicillin-binding protein 4) [Conexibacter arvalis]
MTGRAETAERRRERNAGRRRRAIAGGAVAALALTLAAAGPAPAAETPPPSVAAELAAVTGKPLYDGSIWGYEVADARTGEVLATHNAGKTFVTGSILKVFSSATALEALGADHRFRTPVHRRGRVVDGDLRGDLVLVAAGDTSFGLRDRPDGTLSFNDAPEADHNYADTGLPGAARPPGATPLAGVADLARQVRAAGIRRVRGDVAIDDRLFRTTRDGPDGTIAPIWVNENVLDVVSAPTRPGRPARVRVHPRTSALRVDARVRTVARAGAPVTVRVDGDRVVVRGTVAAGGGPVLSIAHLADPARFARVAFIDALRRAGVRVDARTAGPNPRRLLPRSRAYPRATRVAVRVSPPLSEYVKVILKVSYNRGAHQLLCLVAAARGSRDCESGLRDELALLRRHGVSPRTTVVLDGAGSSEYDRSTPGDFTRFLRSIQETSWGAVLRAGLPTLGVDGSLAADQRGTPAAGRVMAKTGTRASSAPYGTGILTALSQAGYIDGAGGRPLVFALFVRDVPLSPGFPEVGLAGADLSALSAAFQRGW